MGASVTGQLHPSADVTDHEIGGLRNCRAAELLIDCVIVANGDAEIRYVVPTSPRRTARAFASCGKDHLDVPATAR